MELNIQTPALLFPAVSLLMLAYTNKFLAIANLIREGKTHMIYGAIETGSKYGMVPLDRALADLVNSGMISFEDALAKASDPQKLREYSGHGSGPRVESNRSVVY
jgi:Tfp pilus assembly pilus retraction ATPase PilT